MDSLPACVGCYQFDSASLHECTLTRGLDQYYIFELISYFGLQLSIVPKPKDLATDVRNPNGSGLSCIVVYEYMAFLVGC